MIAGRTAVVAKTGSFINDEDRDILPTSTSRHPAAVPPNLPPNPPANPDPNEDATQPLDAGDRMLTTLAVIAPVSLAGPNAVAHCPTATAADVAETLLVNVVFDVKVTFDVLVVVLSLVELEPAFVVVLVLELLDALVGRTGTVPLTTKVDPEIEVTLPNAFEKVKVRPAAPPGNVPPGTVPLGNVPLVNEPLGGRNPPKPPAPAPPAPAPPNPPPPVHDPVELGWVIDTVVAVKWLEDDLDDSVDLVDELLVAVTQSPTASCDEGRVTVWLKLVEAVQVTVTWPLAGFWTSIEVPGTTAAMVPEAVDTDGLGIVVVVVVFLGAFAASAHPPTDAMPVTRARPSPRAANLQRKADRTILARGPLDSAPIKAGKSCSLVMLVAALAPPPNLQRCG